MIYAVCYGILGILRLRLHSPLSVVEGRLVNELFRLILKVGIE